MRNSIFDCITFLLFGVCAFYSGKGLERADNLQHCKEAGWEFVDEFFYNITDPTEHKNRMTLHSRIATKCITKIDK